MMKVILVISMLAAVAPAAVKRDEFGGASGGTGSNGNQPVYSASASSGSFNNAGGANTYGTNGYAARDSSSYTGSNQYSSSDHTAAASSPSSSYQAQPSSQGNLYYYYYPVQEKPKDGSYQASPSNQYSSAVQPNFGTGAVSGESSQHSGLEPAASGQDLSYSAQDLSYSAQNIGQGIGQGIGQDYSAQNGASYDQQLSSLASQLQQYGFNAGSGASAYNPQFAASSTSYDQTSYPGGTGGAYGAASSPSGTTYGAQSGSDSSNTYSGQPGYGSGSTFSGQSSAQIPYGPQSAYGPYGAQQFGNFASASGPQATYEPASSGYRRYGIGSILMPMLALAGLSLLIPTVTSLTSSGRKKRSTEDSAKDSAMTGYIDRLERYYSIYRTAVEREECMNRIICELGDAMSGVRGKSTMLTVLEKVVPTWMGTKMGVFKNAALSGEYGKCKKYSC